MTLEFDVPFTLKELDEFLSKSYDGWNSLGNEDPSFIETPYGLVEVVEIDQRYVDDYQFDAWLIVSLNGKLYKKSGFYQSYDGYSWDGKLTRVEKKPVTREEWVEV